MTDWKECRLGDISSYINRGVTPSYSDDGVIVINQKCIRDFKISYAQSRYTDNNKKKISSEKYLQSFDILINSTGQGTLGRVGQVKTISIPTTVDSHITIVRINQPFNPIYIGYVLKSKQALIENLAEGTTGQTELSRYKVADISISIPDLSTQTIIAETLSSIDDKIELNNQINRNIEALTQALFKKWFIDFEFPDENGLPYKSSGGEMVESELGEIPKGWIIGILDDLVTIKGGTTPSTTEPSYWEGDIYWTSPKDLSNLICPVLLTTEKRITKEGLKKIGSGLLPKGTLLLSSRAPIGYLAITNIETAINQGYIAINSKSGCSNQYMLYWLKQNMDVIISHANGSTFLEISKSKFKQIKVVIPPTEIHNSFYEQASVIFEQLIVNQRETQHLNELRDFLLPKLISGELKISDVKILEPV